MIIDKLIERIDMLDNPTVVGLDPRLEYIPGYIRQQAYDTHGKTPQAVATAFLEFNKGLVDGLCDIVPAVKPQIAMYEQYGIWGIDAFIKTVTYAKQRGMIVIGDIKRSDIASTADAYSDGHLGVVDIEGSEHVIFDEDFVTLNPYLGLDSIEPFLRNCRSRDRGLFILVKTSNPNAFQIQDLETESGYVYEHVGRFVEQWGREFIGTYGYSSIGAVVGATHPKQLYDLRQMLPHTYFLIPGYGAQGGKAEDIKRVFDENGRGAIVNNSRGIMCAYQKGSYDERDYAKAAKDAALKMKDELTL